MKLHQILLTEAEAKQSEATADFIKNAGAKVVDASRVIISNRKLDNNQNIPYDVLTDQVDIYRCDLHNAPSYAANPKTSVGLIVKKGTKVPDVVALFDKDRPNIDPITNKAIYTTDKMSNVVYDKAEKTTVLDMLKQGFKLFIVSKPVLTLKDASVSEPKPEEIAPQDGYFAIISWGDPHNAEDEYAWVGPFATRANALKAATNRLKRGPKGFVDWMGENKKVVQGVDAFKKAATKVGLKPALTNNLEFQDHTLG